ncbi:4Fe-4S dicluster domain-containing protein [Anoxybacterium hadale]|uniref:4Fe-4S dicluster domain-containing protein n=1 Tax=Anoxybacterium hadale TaxID=3408580 RepID=A0ACD1A872_9FIRM|nr:4Fe-4S dicluster domain-containing protein [Clostridiales bacterium]
MNGHDGTNFEKILVCCGTCCLANNSMDIDSGLKERIQQAGLPLEVEPMVKATGCSGLCENGPIVRFLPDDLCYYKVKPGDVDEVFEKTVLNKQEIDRLMHREPEQRNRVRTREENSFYKKQFRIALRNTGEIDPFSIQDYMERGGYSAAKKALKMTPEEILTEIEGSGLRGRGGAGFPTGRKWRQCAGIGRYPKYTICNGDEGDPGAFMDRCILEGDPHSIIEGMLIGSLAIGANSGYLYIRNEYGLAVRTMEEAICQAREKGFLGKNIFGSGYEFHLQIVKGGGAFVCGESTALMASIEGNTGEPRAKYIRSVERGLWGQPTLLNNVETWANIPEIINRGGSWFSSIGTEKSKGTKVFSLVGKVKNNGLVEVPMGITLRELIFEIGGGIIGGRRFKAVQTGGPSGGCIPQELLDMKVDFDSLEAADSMMGSGGMIVMDERTCMVDTARYYINFLSEESCGKCVPCREGLRRMLEVLDGITEGKGSEEDLELLIWLGSMMKEAALCGLGKSAPNPVLSTIKYFRQEYLSHIRDQRCPAGICKKLTTFRILEEKCTGCGLCKKNCGVGAISGKPRLSHVIDEELCTRCGNCIDVCRFQAVEIG